MQERGTVTPLIHGAAAQRRALAFAVAATVLVADRVTTALAEDHLHRVVHLWGPFGLALTFNSGVAFSLFSGRAVVVTVLLCAAVVVLAVVVAQVRTFPQAIGGGLVLGGAAANVSERLAGGHQGQVPDFVTLSHWPTFNLADACVTVGVVVLVVALVAGRPQPGAGGGMSGHTISLEVPALLDAVRVDRGVAMLADVSRTVASELIAAGRVQIDGEAVTVGRHPLRGGTTISIVVPDAGADGVGAEPDIAFRVVQADAAVVVIDKPAGLVVHPGAGHRRGTLVGGLLARFPDTAGLVEAGVCAADRPGIVHRLDKGTSGLMVVARTEPAYTALVAQLADRSMQRRYLALVEGSVADDRGEIDAPIGRSARTPTKMAVSAGGRPARTGYTVRERRHVPRETTLLELGLESGRTHQIRVHMAAIGHPVVGDARYGAPDPRLGAGRFFLHAYRLGFTHPSSGERVEFEAPLPDDLADYGDV